MDELIFRHLDPDVGYLSNNLLLPKSKVPLVPIQEALTFIIGEEDIIDEFGDILGKGPKKIQLWDETSTHIIVPREFVFRDRYKLYDFPIIDIRPTKFEQVDISDRISLRDEVQETSLEKLEQNECGTLNLSCGKGKTVIALKLMASLRVPTLVVVNSTALFEQWIKAIHEHLDVESVGTVQGQDLDWEGHPIVIAMVHTLSQNADEWPEAFRRRFGLVIYDEGHHMSAPVFVKSADLFYGRRFSLTATARRTDGNESIYQYHLGRIVYSALDQQLVPETIFHTFSWVIPDKDMRLITDKSGEINMPRVRTYLGLLEARNEIIIALITKDLEDGRQILVLSHSKDHVKSLSAVLQGGADITGDTDQKLRMDLLKNFNPVFGTFQLAREGLDKPELDTLYVLTPFGNSNDLQQSWGRIQRVYDGKKSPLVRVFEDELIRPEGKNIKICVAMCASLRRYLKALKYPFRKVKEET